MSLQRIEKIRCYAKPYKSHFQLLSSKAGRLHPTAPRALHSETLIQENNSTSPTNGANQNQASYIESLCKSFHLSCATNPSPFGNLQTNKKKKEVPFSMPVKEEQCQRCAKIRNNVKKFFTSKFLTRTASETETGTIPRRIQNHEVALRPRCHNIKSTVVSHAHNTVCYGCDQPPKREPSIRGPPIISPVCRVNAKPRGRLNANPRGEVYKNLPERVKKVVKIDRPRSLGLKRVPQADQPNETSVHERPKSHGR